MGITFERFKMPGAVQFFLWLLLLGSIEAHPLMGKQKRSLVGSGPSAAIFGSFGSGVAGTLSNPVKSRGLTFANMPVCKYLPYLDNNGRLRLSQKDCKQSTEVPSSTIEEIFTPSSNPSIDLSSTTQTTAIFSSKQDSSSSPECTMDSQCPLSFCEKNKCSNSPK